MRTDEEIINDLAMINVADDKKIYDRKEKAFMEVLLDIRSSLNDLVNKEE